MCIKFGRDYDRKISFSPKIEYLRLNGNDFKSGFGGWTLEGTDSIDRGGNSLILDLQFLVFDSS